MSNKDSEEEKIVIVCDSREREVIDALKEIIEEESLKIKVEIKRFKLRGYLIAENLFILRKKEAELLEPAVIDINILIEYFRQFIDITELDESSEVTAKLIEIIIKKEQLTVADFIISEKTSIERKRGDDLVLTFTGNEREDEFRRMVETYQKNIVILENFNRLFDTNVLPNAIYGMLCKIVQHYEIPIIPTRDIEETARLLIRMAIREQKELNLDVLVRKKPKFENLNEPDPKKLARILRKYQVYFLQGLIGMGAKKTKTLLETFKTPAKVIKAFLETDIITTGKKMKIKKPTRLSKIKGFAGKSIHSNKQMLSVDTYKLEAGEDTSG
jgi:ERCC4-type nuclease